MKLASPIVLALALATVAAGCRTTTADDEELAADGTEAMSASSQSTNLASVVFQSVSSQDPAMAAQQVAPATALWPAGCSTRSRDTANANLVHITFKDCTGPFGLLHLNGGVDVTFSANADGSLHAALAGQSLSANGHPVAYDATADITVDGATRDVKWHGHWNATTALGNTVDHTSDLTITVDTSAQCRTADGTAQTTVGARGVDTTISAYKVCLNATGEEACPSGTVTHTGKVTKRTVTIALDGSAEAKVTGPGGNTFDVPLVCPAG